jgi:hypothetical protein
MSRIAKAAVFRMWSVWSGKPAKGGWLFFDKHGKGGTWYSDSVCRSMDDTDVAIDCPRDSVEAQESLEDFTARIQLWVDEGIKDREQERLDDLALIACRKVKPWKS